MARNRAYIFVAPAQSCYWHRAVTVDPRPSWSARWGTPGSLYAGYRGGPWWGNAILTYGHLAFGVNRDVPIGISVQHNNGSTDGSNWSLATEGGYKFRDGWFTHGPIVGLTLQRVSYSKTSPARTSNVGTTAALQFGILASRSCSSIARRSQVLLISARECARSRLVSAITAFSRSISRRLSETREDTGLSSTGSAHCRATRCASTRLPNAQGLIQGSTADGTSDRNRSSMGTTGHLSVPVSPGAVAPNLRA